MEENARRRVGLIIGEASADPEAPGRVAAAFGEAARRAPDRLHEAWIHLAGRSVRLRIVGEELALQILRPFTHLAAPAPGVAPDLTVELWDESVVGIAPPTVRFGERWETRGGLFSASPDGRHVAFEYAGSLTLLDRARGAIVGARAVGGPLAKNDRSKPLIIQLSIWCHDRGVHVLHAALVARAGRGVLLPGRGGVGKTTAALACLGDGFEYVGDDFVGLEETRDGSFVGHSLFSSACLRPSDVDRFPAFRGRALAASYPDEYKATLFLAELSAARLRPVAPIHAIALPRVDPGAATRTAPARPAEALRRLAPGTFVNVVPRPGPDTLEKMARLVTRVPSHLLTIGDPADVPARLARLVAIDGPPA